MFSIDYIKACEQRAKNFEISIHRMQKMQGDYSVLLWGNRASLGLVEYQLSMLGHRRRRRR